jgi:hypothetical protein
MVKRELDILVVPNLGEVVGLQKPSVFEMSTCTCEGFDGLKP